MNHEENVTVDNCSRLNEMPMHVPVDNARSLIRITASDIDEDSSLFYQVYPLITLAANTI